MKKLIIAMTAAWAGAYIAHAAEGTISCTSFEGLTAGDPLNITFTDNGEAMGDKYWSVEGYVSGEGTLPEVGVISNHVEGVTLPTRHAEFVGSDNNNYLAVDTEKKLFRNINADGSASGITSTGLFVDTLVQFTATETAPTPDAADKLIVWLQAIDADEATGVEGSTNLVVTAGQLDDEASPTKNDYVISNVSIEPNSWHRLTIKSMLADFTTADGSVQVPKFEVLIDGTTLSTAANDTLFASLVKYNGTGAKTLTSLAVEGTGAIDDIVFTTVDPFAAPVVDTFDFAYTLAGEDEAVEMVVGVKYAVDGGAVADLGVAGAKIPVTAENVVVSVILPEGFKVQGGTNAGAADAEECYIWNVTKNVAGTVKDASVSLTITIVADEGGATEITADDVTLSATTAEYSATLTFPTVTVTVNGEELIAGTDYTATWNKQLSGADTYTVTVAGINDYKGTVTATFVVTPAQDAGKAKIGDQEYENGADFVKDATSATSNKLPADWTVVNNVIKDAEGKEFATLPDFYTATLAADGTLTLALNDNAKTTVAIDTTAETPLAVAEGVALAVTVTNEKLYYALASSTSLTGTYAAPAAEKYVKGNGGKLTLTADKSGATCFYKIVVTDVVPTTAE